MDATAVVPAGAGKGRPLLVFLHGRNNDADSNLDDEMFAALRAQGPRAPVVVFPDGDEDKYWHDRDSGRFGSYVTEDVIPQARERFETDGQVAIGGMSIGGFGALDIGLSADTRFCAIGAHSPALWVSAGETAPGAFDDAEDFAEHDVIGTVQREPARAARQPIWMDAGREDPFDPGVRAMSAALSAGGVPATSRRPPGGHEREYWREQWGSYMRFYATSLARC